jgi:hypothetical protein
VLLTESHRGGSNPSSTANKFVNINTMAEFSKQWAELYDPEFPWDFDIEVEAESIPKGHYKSIICEGFGFSGIGVRLNGDIEILLIDPTAEDTLIQVDYKRYISLHKSKLENNG